MKLNKSKNKGKVHPSPLINNNNNTIIDPISTLTKLLPKTILTLISILSLQDKQVLTYMITTASSSSSFTSIESNYDNGKKKVTNFNNNGKKTPTTKKNHKVPSFDCSCFDCYTYYWFKWDNSPNRELIHLAIEAFEEHHLLQQQQQQPSNNKKSNRRNNKVKQMSVDSVGIHDLSLNPVTNDDSNSRDIGIGIGIHDLGLNSVSGNFINDVGSSGSVVEKGVGVEDELLEIPTENLENDGHDKSINRVYFQQQQQHKGLVRKVLPDVIGLFNSRLFNLWGPNV